MSGRQQQLSVAVAAALPLQVAGFRIETGEDPVIQPVDKALVQNGAVELILHAIAGPDDARLETAALRSQFQQGGAVSVGGGKVNPVTRDDNRLGDIDVI